MAVSAARLLHSYGPNLHFQAEKKSRAARKPEKKAPSSPKLPKARKAVPAAASNEAGPSKAPKSLDLQQPSKRPKAPAVPKPLPPLQITPVAKAAQRPAPSMAPEAAALPPSFPKPREASPVEPFEVEFKELKVGLQCLSRPRCSPGLTLDQIF